MAKLTDIVIYLEHDDGSSETMEMKRIFNRTSIPVTEIFLSLMERRILDGRSKLNIFLRRSAAKHQVYEPYPVRMGSISDYHLGGFDWTSYLSANEQARGDTVVDILESSLSDLCTKCNADPTPYKQAAHQTRATGYSVDYEIRSMSRSTRDRRCRFSVHRTLRAGSEAWRVDLIDHTNGIVTPIPITDNIMTISARYEFRHGVVDCDTFSILDFQRRPVFSLSRQGDIKLPFTKAPSPLGRVDG